MEDTQGHRDMTQQDTLGPLPGEGEASDLVISPTTRQEVPRAKGQQGSGSQRLGAEGVAGVRVCQGGLTWGGPSPEEPA